MSEQLKILLVANSVPLPATDFLKYKLAGLSSTFDLHYICWDTKGNKKEFCRLYGVPENNIHVFYNKWNTATFYRLVLLSIVRVVFVPHISIPLLARLVHSYGLKKSFIKFCLYYPIIKLKPDIIHFEYGTLAQAFSDIKRYIQAKTAVSFRGYDINYVGLEDKKYYGDVWSSFDGFHFLGNDLKKRAMKRGYRGSAQEAIIPPAIDTTFFTPAGKNRGNIPFNIVSVGRLAWKKGYEYGLQAMAILKAKGIPFTYRIVADGHYRQAIVFTMYELGLENEVAISPASSAIEVKEVLQHADVLLHPAVSEGFSNAVLEAQAMGVPVIATSADGLTENVEDGVTGFIVPVFDVQAMAEKLEWCYYNREQATAMGIAGMKRVQEKFRIEDQLEKFAMFYKRLHEQ